MWPEDKSDINITDPAQRFVGRWCLGPLLKLIYKEVSNDRAKQGAHIHSINLLVESPTNRDVEVRTCLNKARMFSLKCWVRRFRDSTIGTWVNRDATLKPTALTCKEPKVRTNSKVFITWWRVPHKWTKYTCRTWTACRQGLQCCLQQALDGWPLYESWVIQPNGLVPARSSRLQTSSANVDFLSRSDILCSTISVGPLDHLLYAGSL